jgi:hypothetical protein
MRYVFKDVAKDLICIGSLPVVRLLWDGRRSVARRAVGEHAEKFVRGVWVTSSLGRRFAGG